MTNIFKRIGDNLEKKQLEKKKVNEKYWKLSSIERIEYGMHIKNINEKYEVGMYATIVWFKILFYTTLFILFFSFIFDITLINSLKLVWIVLIKYIWIPLVIDLINWMSNINYGSKSINKLNKRFKLC